MLACLHAQPLRQGVFARLQHRRGALRVQPQPLVLDQRLLACERRPLGPDGVLAASRRDRRMVQAIALAAYSRCWKAVL